MKVIDIIPHLREQALDIAKKLFPQHADDPVYLQGYFGCTCSDEDCQQFQNHVAVQLLGHQLKRINKTWDDLQSWSM